jgi:hypothetical protein
MVANIALTTAGTLIAAMESGIFHITLQDGPAVNASLLAALPEAGPGIRFNDGRCDRQGVTGAAPCSWIWLQRGISAICTATPPMKDYLRRWSASY